MAHLFEEVVATAFPHPEMGGLGLAGLARILREEILGKAQDHRIPNFGGTGHSRKVYEVVR